MNKKRIIDLGLSLACLATIALLYRYDLNYHREWVHHLPEWAARLFIMIYVPKILKAGFILLHIWFSLRLIFYSLLKASRLNPIYKQLLLLFTSLYILFLFLEGIFTFVGVSNQNWNALAQKNWLLYYSNQLNQLGYRDREITKADVQKKKILIAGDSFARGDGIKDLGQNFAGQLQNMLPEDWRVFNISKSGVGLRGKFYHIAQFPFKPDLIILQYFPNDPMEDYQSERLHRHSFKTIKSKTFLGQLANRYSYFINFISYYIRPGLSATQDGFTEMLVSLYHNEALMAQHRHELGTIVRFARKNEVPLVLLYFPFLTENSPDKTVYYTFVKDFCKKQMVPMINAGDMLSGMEKEKRVVNRWDHHPSAELHKKTAELIYLKIQALGYLHAH